MRKNPYVFTKDEYIFLHQRFLKTEEEDTKLFKRIKAKRGVGLDRSEIKYIKNRFTKWRGENPHPFYPQAKFY
ncbi:hypothetical protein HY643_01500 [Candidatus Woesearchaeota archaeon]|nr:hypothetical protein [Candidatus Woesearchaeota archaeon]